MNKGVATNGEYPDEFPEKVKGQNFCPFTFVDPLG